MLICTGGVIIIPLSAPGCVGEIRLMMAGEVIEGTTNDLSAFGVDFNVPVQLTCVGKAGKIEIVVNGEAAYGGRLAKDIGKIVGFRITFEGSGKMKLPQLAKARQELFSTALMNYYSNYLILVSKYVFKI